MKKIFAAALAVCLTLSLTVPAWAAYTPGKTENNITPDILTSWDKADNDSVADNKAGVATAGIADAQKEIPITVSKSKQDPQHVLAVAVDTTELHFTYTQGSMIWDPVNLKYVKKDPRMKDWDYSNQTLTVTNYSDLDVNVQASLEHKMQDTVTLSVAAEGPAGDTATLLLQSAYQGYGQPAKAANGTLTVAIQGLLDPDVTMNHTQVGTLTLKLEVPTSPAP